jgi:Flp pilus assembly protein TadD
MAETQRGNLAEAQRLYRRLTTEQPGDATAWLGLAAVSSRLDDLATSEQALERLIAIEPGNAGARDMLERVRAARAARGLSAPR